jgi:DoxX
MTTRENPRENILIAKAQVIDAGDHVDSRLASWMAKNCVPLTRIALGVVFFWFGILKFFPGSSDAERLAVQTILKLSAGHIAPSISLPVLAAWECLIGLGLLSGKFMRVTLLLLFLQLPGTFLPLFFSPLRLGSTSPMSPR